MDDLKQFAPEEPRIETVTSDAEPNIPHHEVAGLARRRVQLSLDAYRDRRDDTLEFFKAYKGIREEPSYPWESDMVLPEVFSAIETIFPHVYADGMRVGVKPGLGADAKKKEVWEGLLDHDFRQSKVDDVAPMTVKQGLFYGYSPFMVTYHYDKRRMRVREFDRFFEGTPFETSIPRNESRDVVSFDGPLLQFVDALNWLPQPGKWRVNAPAGEGMDWCGARFIVPRNVLYPMVERGIISKDKLKALKETSFPTHGAFADADSDYDDRLRLVGVDPLTVDDTMQQFELIVFFGDRGFNRPPGLIWLANRSVVLRDERDPFWHGMLPFGCLNDYQVPGELMGMGEAELTKVFQEEKSDLRNAALDNIHQSVAKMYLVDREAEIDEAELIARPGQIIHRNAGYTGVEEFAKRDVPFSTFQHEQMIDKDKQQAVGALDLLHGMDQSASRPVGRTDELKAGFAAARISPKVYNLKHQFYRVVGELFIKLEQQFMTQRKSIRVFKDDFSRDIIIDPADIAGEWEPVPIVDEKLPLGDFARKQQSTVVLNSLAPFFGNGVEMDPVILQFLEAYGVHEPRRYLTSWKQAQQAAADPSQMADEALGNMQQEDGRAAAAAGNDPLQVIQGGVG